MDVLFPRDQAVVNDCLNNGLGMASYIKKSRASCPGGRFPPSSFIK